MLEQLKQMAKTMFDNATSKEEIERATKLNTLVEEAEKEVNSKVEKLEGENKEYLETVKELAKHTSFKEQPKEPSKTATPKTFEELLAEVKQAEINAKK